MEANKIDKIWNTLNSFSMKYFLTKTKAEIDVSDFDELMEDIRKILLSNESK